MKAGRAAKVRSSQGLSAEAAAAESESSAAESFARVYANSNDINVSNMNVAMPKGFSTDDDVIDTEKAPSAAAASTGGGSDTGAAGGAHCAGQIVRGKARLIQKNIL